MAGLERLVDEYLEETWRQNPVLATITGVHTYDHLLPDYRPASVVAGHRRYRELLEAFQALPAADLDAERRLDHRLAISELETLVELHRLREWQRSPTLYADQAISGVYYLTVREFGTLQERLGAVRQRLLALPELLATARRNLTEETPSINAEIAAGMARGARQFLESAIPPLAGQIADGGAALLAANTGAISAFEDFAGFLDDLRPRCRGSFAIGRELFDFLLRRSHLLDVNADQLSAWGERMFARTVEQIEATARQIDPGRPWTEIVAAAKRDHPAADELLDAYRRAMDRARRFAAERELITFAPGEELTVVETPVFLRNIMPYAAYDPPPAFGPDMKGIFYVTPVTADVPPDVREQQLEGHSYGTLPVIALHEAYPGHHVQLTRTKLLDSKLRRRASSTVFVEGWALYCEEMMYENGFYESPLVRLFQLKDVLWRAGRVIVDVGLHARGMSFQEAVDFMVDRVHLERPHAEAEVRRYTISPTQPMSYLVGKHQILDMRDQVRARAGDRFSLRAFHDHLISFGTVPPPLIRDLVVGL